ncbi:MAG: caspase family protein [Cyclobacteriaceae bacterium]|nr:caspase family protein [Cyclobacteriaceae bacterium]
MLTARSYILFVLLLPLSIASVFAQKIPNITGYWNGVAEVPFSQDIIIEYFFTQKGAILEGYSTSMSLNHKDSARTIFSGTAKTKSIEIRQTEYVYKTSAGCLSTIRLEYSNANGQEKLIGKWSGSFGKNTCPPGTGGKVELLKVSSPVLGTTRTSDSDVISQPTNTYGTLLYEELQKRNYYALLIGIDTYEDDGIQDLDEPVSDVKKFNSILQTSYTFAPENTIVLQNPTRDQIIDAFDVLANKVTPTDQLLVFYAGHGIWDENMKQGFWLPTDAKRDSKSRWLSNSTIRDYIGGINSKHTLLITDACFSGSIFKERAVTFENSRAVLEQYKLASRKAMTSGTLKTVPDRSVFVNYLIKNLADNNQPMISAEDLFRTFKTAVINNSPNGQVPQYGAIGQVGDEGGDFIFLKKPGH